MKKRLFLIIFIIFTLTGAGYYALTAADDGKPSAESTYATVTRGNMETIVTAQGTLEPENYVDVGAQVSGLIQKMHFEIGDIVEKGDLVAEIDPDVYEAQVRADEARLNQLAAQKKQQEALIKQAQWKYDRNKNLYADQAVSKEALEDAEITLDVAKANLLSLQAQIKEAQSQLEGAKTNLNYTKIYAPMTGTIVDQLVKEGQTINANQTTPTIVQVANLDTMTAKAEVAEADVMKLKPNMEMYFTTLGSGERRWHGKIRQILPTPEEINDVVLYNVLVDVNNDDHKLLPGMTAQMFFVLEKAENVPIIPENALGRRMPEADTENGTAYQVTVKTPSGPQTRTILISMSDRSRAVVISGLNESDQVLQNPRGLDSQERGRRGGLGRL